MLEEQLQLSGLELPIMPGVGEEHLVLVIAGGGLDALGDLRHEAAGEGGQDDANCLCAAPEQVAGDLVGR